MIILIIISYSAGIKKTDESFIKSFIYFFNLNQKFNGAMWISVFMWMIRGLSFVIFGLNKSSTVTLSDIQKKIPGFSWSFYLPFVIQKNF